MDNLNPIESFTHYWDVAKGAAIGFITAATAYFLPIESFFKIITILFIINFAVGWRTGAKVHHETFSLDKAFKAIKHIVIYSALLAVCFYVGKEMPTEDNNVIEFVSWLTWAVIYFYALNILKNGKQLYPENQLIGLLYNVVNFKLKNIISKYTNINSNNDGKSNS